MSEEQESQPSIEERLSSLEQTSEVLTQQFYQMLVMMAAMQVKTLYESYEDKWPSREALVHAYAEMKATEVTEGIVSFVKEIIEAEDTSIGGKLFAKAMAKAVAKLRSRGEELSRKLQSSVESNGQEK